MFPATRLRRLRQQPILRNLVRETTLSAQDFILPLFVRPGQRHSQGDRVDAGQFSAQRRSR